MSRRFWLGAVVLLLVAPMFVGIGTAATPIEVTVNPNNLVRNNTFSLGFVLHGDARTWLNRPVLTQMADTANFRLIRIFSDTLLRPCSSWYESTKTGKFDWTTVDQLVRKIIEIGAQPLITMGFYSWELNRISVPSGMATNPTTGLPNTGSWAAYCAEWVKHFKTAGLPVEYYEIVNEPHHYFGWGPSADKTKLRYYIDLFNAAARAMRAQNPNIKLGNDNSVMKLVLDYFITYGENLDFISYHSYGTGSLSASDSDIFNAAETKYITETSSVYGVLKARELYKTSKGVELPVFNTENNLNYYYGRTTGYGTDPRLQQMQSAVYTALCVRTFVLNNIKTNLYYTFGGSGSSSVNFGMVNLDNDKPWYPYYAQQMIGPNLLPGDKIIESTSSSSSIRTLSWISQEKLNVLLICKSSSLQTVTLRGITGVLTYQKIDNTISWKTPAIQTGTLDSASSISLNGYTVMLLQQDYDQSTPPPPPPPPPPQTSAFSDGFESGDFSKWTGTTVSSGETSTVRNWRPHDATYHARFTSNGGASLEDAYCYKTLGGQEMYIRGYVYIASGLSLSDDGDRFYFIRLTANGQSLAGAGVRRNLGVDSWVLYGKDGSAWAGPIYSSTQAIKTGTWYCVELHWKPHNSDGLVELYVNGVKTLELTGINTSSLGNPDTVNFGLISVTDVQRSLIVYGDSFEVSDQYIGLD